MKFLIFTFLILISELSMAYVEEISCTNEKGTLHLFVNTANFEKFVSWELKNTQNISIVTGSGRWNKEIESVDAFSAFDENSSIGFKNNRAVVVIENDLVIVFNSCTSLQTITQ